LLKGEKMVRLPKNFIDTIKSLHKKEGETWLSEFESLVQYCEKRWNMEILEPYELSYNFVAPGIMKNGEKVVVKLVVPSDQGYLNELSALKTFNGNGIARLIDEEVSRGVMILECLLPGKQLASIIDDQKATVIMSKVMKELWVEAPTESTMPTLLEREQEVKDILMKNPKGLGPISREMLTEVVNLFHYLNGTIKKHYLLHGDLHHYNVLSAGDKWLAIDPKGLIGEREYDVIQFLFNKMPDENRKDVLYKRINILVDELNLNEERVLLWGYCHSVLALCWYIEGFGKSMESVEETIHGFKELYCSLYGGFDEKLLGMRENFFSCEK